jgi:hypothetical protein
MGLRKKLSLIRGMRRALTEDEQGKVATCIVEHLESTNWKIEQVRPGRGTARTSCRSKRLCVTADCSGGTALMRFPTIKRLSMALLFVAISSVASSSLSDLAGH